MELLMKYILWTSFLCLAVLISPVHADDAKSKGLYGSLNASYVNLRDATFSDGTDSAEVESDGGFGLMAALGYKFDNNLRAEGELSFRRNSIDNVSGTQFDGRSKAWGFMANGYYDFNTGGSIQPYLGAGIGVAHVSVKGDGAVFFADGDDNVFAYQGIAGVAIPVAAGTSLGAEYRYFATDNPKDAGVEAEYRTHNIGLRLTKYF